MNVFAILAVIGVATLALAEILIAVQKSQMKKQFLEELDRKEKTEGDADEGFRNPE